MGILDFLIRIVDNILWLLRTDNPAEIAQAVINIVILMADNLFRLIVWPIVYLFSN